MPHSFDRTRRAFLAQALILPAANRIILGGSVDAKPRRFIDGRIVYGDFVPIQAAAVVGGPIYEGVEIQIDLPPAQQIRNFGAPDDGLGLCVFASMTHSARWHNARPLFDVIHKISKGGGYPEKVDKVLKQFAPGLEYVQYEGTDPSMLEKALAEGRMACVTYGFGERYQGQTIYHMVNLVHLDSQLACVLDNNFPNVAGKPGTYEWMPRAEFLRRWVHPTGQGWAYIFLTPGPPPIPHS